jgi:hypothetical protein
MPEATTLTPRRMGLHPAWPVAVVAFVALVGAAGFRAAPGVLMVPLEEEFGCAGAIRDTTGEYTIAWFVPRPCVQWLLRSPSAFGVRLRRIQHPRS